MFFTKLETSLHVWRECISLMWMRIYHYVVVTAALISMVSLAFSLSLSALFSPLDQLAERCHVSLRRAGHLIGSSHTFKGPGLSNLHSFPAFHSLSSVSLHFSLINLPVLRAWRLTNGWWVSKRVNWYPPILLILFGRSSWSSHGISRSKIHEKPCRNGNVFELQGDVSGKMEIGWYCFLWLILIQICLFYLFFYI